MGTAIFSYKKHFLVNFHVEAIDAVEVNAFWVLELYKTPEKNLNAFYKKVLSCQQMKESTKKPLVSNRIGWILFWPQWKAMDPSLS